MLRKPPHLLVTTPESLYILLTSKRGREMLSTVKTVIVDEIHALARDKRGSHLALSLERLEALAGPFQRIGLSATQKPLSEVARFLVGTGRECDLVDVGHHRPMDIELVVPPSPLSTVCSHEQWDEIYRQIAGLIESHRTTLVFVNTRKLAERLTARLTEKLGEQQVERKDDRPRPSIRAAKVLENLTQRVAVAIGEDEAGHQPLREAIPPLPPRVLIRHGDVRPRFRAEPFAHTDKIAMNGALFQAGFPRRLGRVARAEIEFRLGEDAAHFVDQFGPPQPRRMEMERDEHRQRALLRRHTGRSPSAFIPALLIRSQPSRASQCSRKGEWTHSRPMRAGTVSA